MPDAHGVDPLENVIDLVDIAGRLTASTVVVVGGDRVEALTLVESARDHCIVDRIILIGRKPCLAAEGIVKDIVYSIAGL